MQSVLAATTLSHGQQSEPCSLCKCVVLLNSYEETNILIIKWIHAIHIREIDSLFHRLDQFISQYDSHWKDKIEGISDEEMNHLKSACKIDEREIDYPEDYLVYLKYMGKKDDGLLGWGFSGKVDTNYSVLLEDLEYINVVGE